VTVQTSQSSIQRGQKATYAVTISTVGSSASNVTVRLTSQPTSQKPTFTSGCAKGNGAASCLISSISDKQSVGLQAQIPVAASASSVTSVTLTATASVVTKAAWTPPAAAEKVGVTAASASASPSVSHSSSSPASSSPGNTTPLSLPLGPQPSLPGDSSSSLIGAGNAAGLFPDISPSPTPSPASGFLANGDPRNNASPVSSSALTLGTRVLPAQVAGLIALALALLLTMTRLSRRRPAAQGPKVTENEKPAPPDDSKKPDDPKK
jgi:hypothetical protein